MDEHRRDDEATRRSVSRLSEAEFEAVAERTAEIVWEKFTMLVGQSAIRLCLYVVGALLLAAIAYLGGKNWLRL